MPSHKKNKTLKIILQTLALLLFLVVLPFGSWYYLKNGMDYRVTTMAELHHLGKVSSATYTTFEGQSLVDSFFRDKILIANILDLKNEALSKLFGETLEKLHEQFDERKDVIFLLHLADTTTTAAEVNNFADNYKLNDDTQLFFIQMDVKIPVSIIEQNYYLPHDAAFPYFSLIDTKGEVRRYYDVRKMEEIKKLVEHTALLVPLEKNKEITFKREQEK